MKSFVYSVIEYVDHSNGRGMILFCNMIIYIFIFIFFFVSLYFQDNCLE